MSFMDVPKKIIGIFAERYVKRHGAEPKLPGLELKQNQLFWLSAANTWCSKYRPKSLEQRIKTGAHSPGINIIININNN